MKREKYLGQGNIWGLAEKGAITELQWEEMKGDRGKEARADIGGGLKTRMVRKRRQKRGRRNNTRRVLRADCRGGSRGRIRHDDEQQVCSSTLRPSTPQQSPTESSAVGCRCCAHVPESGARGWRGASSSRATTRRIGLPAGCGDSVGRQTAQS